LITLNNEMIITYVNHAAEDITGYSQSRMEGSHIRDIFPQIFRYLHTSDGGHPHASRPKLEATDIAFERRDGVKLHLGFSQSKLRDPDGNEFGLILVFQDLTEFRRMQEQVRRMDRLAVAGELAAGIAHEIRNPLASLSGSIQMLKHEVELDSVYQRLMDITVREAERLNSLVNEFLLFARPEKNVDESVDVNKVINDTLEMLENSPEMSRPIRIRRKLSNDVWVHIDSQRLQQVIWNLLLNAVQEMKNTGHISIATAVRYDETSGNEEKKLAEISIKDTGPGIDPENHGKVFDPFFTTKETGTGLGLTIVHRIVENYGGRILLESDGNRGTTFTLHFPLAEVGSESRQRTALTGH
jgi:two-component system sensor histidine kinase PilS (NtrC family)